MLPFPQLFTDQTAKLYVIFLFLSMLICIKKTRIGPLHTDKETKGEKMQIPFPIYFVIYSKLHLHSLGGLVDR